MKRPIGQRSLPETDDYKPILHVYVVARPDGLWSKIGHSIDPKTRLKAFLTGNPDNLTLYFAQIVPRHLGTAVERAAHKLLADEGYTQKLEWTRCPPEIAKEAILSAYNRLRGRNTL